MDKIHKLKFRVNKNQIIYKLVLNLNQSLFRYGDSILKNLFNINILKY